MKTATREPEIIEREVAPNLPMVGGGTVDVQVATARQYPRSVAKFIQSAQEMATLSQEIAMSCVYAIPRDGEMIEGPSARLAEIVASAWGNLRIQAGASDHDDRYVTARGEAWDVERNVAIGFEVRRRITNRSGKTYSDDMIATTGNAAASIALRNAVFKAVPSSFWRPIYLKCREVIAGDARTFASRRDEMMKAFGVMGVTEQQLCSALKLKGKADITLEHMTTLVGILNSLKEGETTIEEAFHIDVTLPKPAQRTTAAPPAATEQPATSPAASASAAETPKADEKPAHIGRITDIREKPDGSAALVVLDTGFAAGTQDKRIISDAKEAREMGAIVELVNLPPSDPAKFKPKILEVKARIDLMEGQS